MVSGAIIIIMRQIGYGEDCAYGRGCEIGVFCRWLREFCSEYVDQFWANVKIPEQVKYGWIEEF